MSTEENLKDKFEITFYSMMDGLKCEPCDEVQKSLDKLKENGWDIEIKKIVPSTKDNLKYDHAPVLEIHTECGSTIIHGFTDHDTLIKDLKSIACSMTKTEEHK
jgi:hypothetical protein